MADKSKTIIIKKVKKGHEGHHGGSWKVAYADFVTAMMAFFLLMWLLAMVSPEKRAALAEYFKHFSLFEKAGQSFMMEGQQQVLQKGGEEVKTFDFGEGKAALSPEDLKEKLKKAIEEKLRALKDQAVVDIFEGGVRIQLVDLEGKSMFQPGSAQLTSSAREILKLVGENIKDLPNRIAVEGHTDASPLKAGRITNWELSTDRASSARRELETNGIDPVRIARVVGYADTELLVKDNPNDPRNRRISIILLQSKVEQPPKVQEPTHPVTQPPTQPSVQPVQPVQPPPPLPPQPEEVKKPAVEKPAPKQEQKRVFEPGIRPQEPIEIKKPIDVPGAKPETQLKTAPQPAAEQAKKLPVAKPEPQKQVPQPKPAPPPPPKPKPEEVKKPQVEKPAPKQEQKKDSTKPDIGIKPIKPIDPIGK